MVVKPTTATGAEIRARRLRVGWTQKGLAEAIGIQQHTISQLETGYSPRPSRLMLRAIDMALTAAEATP